MEYGECLLLQKKIVRLRKNGSIGNTVLFVEHEPVYTIGRKADISNYTNVSPVRTERGGDVTYHGPGQIVAYFIFDTRVSGKRDVGALLRNVEDSVIMACSSQGHKTVIGDEPGFWTAGKKVGSLGMAMDDYVSFHGIALNYSELPIEGFLKINPCGLDSSVMSFIPLDREKFKADLIANLSGAYGDFIEIQPEELTGMINAQDSMPTSHIFS